MYIIVAGGGMVGGGLVRSLLDNKHDVVLVEQHKELCDKMYAETGVVAITGSATSIQALTEAGSDRQRCGQSRLCDIGQELRSAQGHRQDERPGV